MSPTRSTPQTYRSLRFAGLLLLALCPTAWGQYIYTESFANETAAGWNFIQDGTSPAPRLTSGLAPDAVDPEFGQPQIDSAGQGWLRMATTTGDQANAAYLNIALPATGAKVTVEFDFAFWDGDPNPGDGVAFFLSDANVAFSAGAYGGSLGYAQKTGIDGLAGGYVGMGLDVYGNYPNPTEGRVGGPGFDPNNVTVRGAGNGQVGYNFVGSADLDTVVGGANDNLGFSGYTARPDQDALDYRHAIFTLTEDNTYTIQLQFGFESAPVTVLSGTLTGARPDEFRLGFTSGTGGATQVYELRNLEVQIDGGANSFFWDDNAGNDAWTTGSNWDQNTVPTTGATVYFTDAFSDVDNPETVNLGANQEIGGAIFSGAKEYTLAGNTLIFNSPTGNTSRIQIFNNPNGNAEHTIASAVRLDNDLEILHQIEKQFTITGAVNLNGNDLLVDTASSTLISGIISGAGVITKSGDGTLIQSGANTYTGTTIINNGILEARNNGALGNTGAGTTVNNGGTLGLSNDIAIGTEALALNGAGESGRGALLNISGNNSYQGAITLGSASTIASEAGALTLNGTIGGGGFGLTFDTETGAAIVSNGVISGGGTAVTKTGDGTLTLAAGNTYTGATNIDEGTLRITNSAGLGASSGDTVVSSGATLEMAGGLTISANEDLTISGTGVSGKAALWSASGLNLWQGDTTVTGGSASFGAAAGATLRLDGVISGADQDVIITGDGIVTYESGMTYTGDTLIQSGTLRFTGDNRIANTSDVVISTGANLDLDNNDDSVGSIAGGGNIQLGTGTLTTGGNNNDTTYSGVISETGDVVKTGTGTMLVTGVNTFTGTLTINGGTAVDPSTVQINASDRFSAATDLNLGNNGEFLLTGGADQTFTNLTLSSTAAASPSLLDFGAADSDLTFTGTGTAPGTSFLTVQNWDGLLTGNGNSEFLFNSNAAATTVAGRTTFEGWGAATVVANGSLWEVVPLVSGNEWDGTNASNNWNAGTVGTNTNWRTSGGADNNVAAPNAAGATALFRNLDPNLNGATISLNGNRTLGNLIFASTGGQAFTIANNTLTMDATSGSANITLIGNSSPTITSNVTLADNLLISNNTSGTFTMATGTLTGGDFDITATGTGTTIISQAITESGGANSTDIIKNGAGTLRLSGNNTYGGTVTINNGVLEAQSTNALGSTAAGTTVNDGGTLALSNNVTTAAETLSINGAGYNGVGALSNLSGSNTYAGAVTAGSSATIGSQAGTLTLTGGVATGGNVVSYHTNGGNISQNSGITGTGSVVKTGNNTLMMQSGASTFSGGLTVNAGTVTAGSSGAGSLASGITVGATVAGQNYLGTGEVTVNTGGTLTTFQNATATGHDFTIGNTGVLNNTGGTITITNSTAADTNADLILNGTVDNSAGTTSFVDWNDMEVSNPADISVTGGTVNFNLRDDFNNATPNSNALNITVNGGLLNVNLANAETNSTFVLGTDDTLTLNGASSSMSVNAGAPANLVTLDGRVNLENGSTLTVAQGTTVLSSTTILDGGSSATKGTLEVRGDLSVNEPGVANSPNLTINNSTSTQITAPNPGSSITNLGTVTKTGAGTTTINANVNNIEANRIVINQGTLLNGTSNQIDNSTKITLGGGTYDTNGYDEIVDSLTLTANSTIDLDGSAADSILKFDNSSGETWTGGTALSVTGWSGNASGGGTDQIYFGSSSSGLTSGQLGQVQFINPLGFEPGIYGARILSTGEIVPYIPETSSVLAAGMLLGVCFKRRRRRRDL